MRLRLATINDVEFLADTVIEATHEQGRFPPDFNEDEFRREYIEWTTKQLVSTYVIEFDGRSVGRLRVLRARLHIELAGIQLRPEFQSKGIGTLVVRNLMREAAETNMPITLAVENDNPRARAFYARLGFVQTDFTQIEDLMQWPPST